MPAPSLVNTLKNGIYNDKFGLNSNLKFKKNTAGLSNKPVAEKDEKLTACPTMHEGYGQITTKSQFVRKASLRRLVTRLLLGDVSTCAFSNTC